MLELNKNSTITINNLKDFITVNYFIIDTIYQKETPVPMWYGILILLMKTYLLAQQVNLYIT